MKRIMLRMAAMCVLLFITLFSKAQLLLKKDAPFHEAVQKVVAALPGQLQAITGALVADNPQSKEYESKVQLPGSLGSSIVQYATTDQKKIIAAWNAVVMEEEVFKTAAKKFHWLYNQLKAGSFKCGDRTIRFRGKYESPDESLPFTTVMLTQEGDQGKERIELTMQHEITQWVIRVSVYNEDTETLSLIKNGPSQ